MLRDLAALTAQDFEPLIGAAFNARTEQGEMVPLVLARVERLPTVDVPPSVAGTVRPQPFSLVFSGPADRALAQGVAYLSSPDFGDIELFIVPIRPDASGMRYESVFS